VIAQRALAARSLTTDCLCTAPCCVRSTWVLGAPTVSMFYGLRLVAAIVESKIILGATVIKEPVQASVAGG